MRLPIGETEIGAIYEAGKTAAFFYPIDSGFYISMIMQHRIFAVKCSYAEFKEKYPFHIFNNYRSKNFPK